MMNNLDWRPRCEISRPIRMWTRGVREEVVRFDRVDLIEQHIIDHFKSWLGKPYWTTYHLIDWWSFDHYNIWLGKPDWLSNISFDLCNRCIIDDDEDHKEDHDEWWCKLTISTFPFNALWFSMIWMIIPWWWSYFIEILPYQYSLSRHWGSRTVWSRWDIGQSHCSSHSCVRSTVKGWCDQCDNHDQYVQYDQ